MSEGGNFYICISVKTSAVKKCKHDYGVTSFQELSSLQKTALRFKKQSLKNSCLIKTKELTCQLSYDKMSTGSAECVFYY